MATQRKLPACALILILAISSLVMIESAVAQQATPSAPEFTVRLDDYSFTTAPTYTTDPYTGEQKMVSHGQYVSNKTIWVTIKNQPFTPYKDKAGNEINLYYNITYKGHYEQNWAIPHVIVQDYGKEYTAVKILQDPNVPKDGLMDFKVQAIAGYYNESVVEVKIDPYDYERYHLWLYYPGIASGNYTISELVGAKSNWSDVQTIDLSAANVQPTSDSSIANDLSFFPSGWFENSSLMVAVVAFASAVVGSLITIAVVRKLKKL